MLELEEDILDDIDNINDEIADIQNEISDLQIEQKKLRKRVKKLENDGVDDVLDAIEDQGFLNISDKW